MEVGDLPLERAAQCDCAVLPFLQCEKPRLVTVMRDFIHSHHVRMPLRPCPVPRTAPRPLRLAVPYASSAQWHGERLLSRSPCGASARVQIWHRHMNQQDDPFESFFETDELLMDLGQLPQSSWTVLEAGKR